MSFLNNIIKKSKSFLDFKKTKKVLGIDIGSSSIKIVQLSLNKGVAVLDTFGEISLSIYANKEIGTIVALPDETIMKALKDLIKETQADANIACISIPLKSALMFNLKIPKIIERSKLDEVIKIEARKYIPVPIQEVQLDWSILPNVSKQKEEKHYDIVIVAVHKDTLNKYMFILSELRLEVKFMEIETFSTIRAVIKHEKNTTAIIDIGPAITKFYIVENGIVKKSHIINIGFSKTLSHFNNENKSINSKKGINDRAMSLFREEITDIKNIPIDLTRITQEIKKVILNYQKKTGSNVSEAVITGGGVLFKNIIPHLSEELTLNVTIADPFQKVLNPVYLDEPLKEAGPEFAVAVGLALRGLRS